MSDLTDDTFSFTKYLKEFDNTLGIELFNITNTFDKDIFIRMQNIPILVSRLKTIPELWIESENVIKPIFAIVGDLAYFS